MSTETSNLLNLCHARVTAEKCCYNDNYNYLQSNTRKAFMKYTEQWGRSQHLDSWTVTAAIRRRNCYV